MSEMFDRMLTASWQASALAAIVLIVTTTLSRWIPARWRCALWMLVFLRLVMPALPPSPTSVFNFRPPELAVARIDAPVETVTYGVISTEAVPVKMIAARRFEWKSLAAMTWLSIASILMARQCGAMLLLSGHIRRGRPVRGYPVHTVETSIVTTPAITGMFRPTLLLPAGLIKSLCPAELRFVIEHELAHTKRRDVLVGFLATLISCVHWFNPIVWFAAARFRAERELACDEMVLVARDSAGRAAYGRTILALLEHFPPGREPAGAVGVLGSRGAIRRRIKAIASGRARTWSIVGPILVAVMGCGMLTGPKATKTPPATQELASNTPQPAQDDPLDTVTRVYDVRDLLVDVPNFAPNSTTTRPAASRDEMVRELMTTITSTIDPPSWRDNAGLSGSVRELSGQLIVTHTLSHQEQVQKLLQTLRGARGVQIAVEARFIQSKTLARNLEAVGGNWGGTNAELWTKLLSPAEVDQLMRAVQGDIQSTIVTAPRISLFNGQRAYVKVAHDTAYVGDFKADPREPTGYAAVVQLVEDGILFDCQAKVGNDPKLVTLTLRPSMSKLLDIQPKPWPQAPPGKEMLVQVPRVKTYAFDTTITMPNEKTAVYRVRARYSSTTRPVRDDFVILLVKPRLIEATPTEPKQFPLLSTRVNQTTQPAK